MKKGNGKRKLELKNLDIFKSTNFKKATDDVTCFFSHIERNPFPFETVCKIVRSTKRARRLKKKIFFNGGISSEII